MFQEKHHNYNLNFEWQEFSKRSHHTQQESKIKTLDTPYSSFKPISKTLLTKAICQKCKPFELLTIVIFKHTI